MNETTETTKNQRSAGILLPLFSLPSAHGAGCFSAEAYGFIDRLAQAGQRFWQILPIGPAGLADSPYQPLSSFAFDPLYIDLSRLAAEGLLHEDELHAMPWGTDPARIDYAAVRGGRAHLLPLAFQRYQRDPWIGRFEEENAAWLEDYALFMALRDHFGPAIPWCAWPAAIRDRQPEAMAHWRQTLSDEIAFHRWTQYECSREWEGIHGYAKEKGIAIIGDLPFYVSYDSADCWAHPDLFLLDDQRRPSRVAGVPPDAFSACGQLWGNPVYDWEALADTDYAWWTARVHRLASHFDVLRIDHFRGLAAFYSCPSDAEDACGGTWTTGPGLPFLARMQQEAGSTRFIAEDLGFLTPDVHRLRRDAGIPGLKVLQFAFDDDSSNAYLPHNYDSDCVVYTGTHDNNTSRGWFRTCGSTERSQFCRYAAITADREEAAAPAMIRLAQGSVAKTCIIPMQDYLNLDENARCNTPSTIEGNWCWRMLPGACTESLAAEIRKITALYGRL